MLKDLASIKLQWDELGNISQSVEFYVPLNDYQKTDAQLLTVVLLISSQLGILSPPYGLHVCGRLIKFIDGISLNPEQIKYPLSKVQIDLIQKNKTMVCTFDPTFIGRGTMEPEEAVSHLLGNLPSFYSIRLNLANKKEAQLGGYFKNGLLMDMNFYLSEALPRGFSLGLFSQTKFNQSKVQRTMLSFTESIFPHWYGGMYLPKKKYEEALEQSRSQYKKMKSKI